MMATDLMFRYAIIAIAWQLACAWIQAFQSPWPLVDAFELAGSAEEQLLRSLGIRFDAGSFGSTARQLLMLFHTAIVRSAPRKTSRSVYLTCILRHSSCVGRCFSS